MTKHNITSIHTPEPADLASVERLIEIRSVRKVVPLPDTGEIDVRLELEVKSNQGHTWTLSADPAEVLQQPNAILKQAVRRSGCFPRDTGQFEKMISSICDQSPPQQIFQTIQTGWANSEGNRQATLEQFVLPNKTLSKKTATVAVMFANDRATSALATCAVGQKSGSLKDWIDNNARLLGYSSLGITTLGAFLAAPLLPFAELPESMILLLAGQSTTGKTSIQLGAMSFQGLGAPRAIQSPQTTPRAMEELGANFNQLVLPIEDLSRLDKKMQRELLLQLTYNTAAGGGRTVSQGMQRNAKLTQLSFQTIALTVSEKSSSEIADAIGDKRLAGERARLFDIYAQPADEGGLFDLLDRDGEMGRNPKRIAEELKAYAEC